MLGRSDVATRTLLCRARGRLRDRLLLEEQTTDDDRRPPLGQTARLEVTGGRYDQRMSELTTPATRLERDSMGEMAVPADALYGASTQRAVLNFPISGQRFPRRFLQALALIKRAAAETNAELGLLDPAKATAIAEAAQAVADGGYDEHFPIDIYQTGSGTSTNTNANEVIAHLAMARLGEGAKVHPNDDVNRCQSSNDVIPAALQLSAAMAIEEDLVPALERLHTALGREGERVLGRRQDRSHAPPGRDAHPARTGVPRLRRPGRGGAPPGPRRPGRAARRAPRWHRGGYRHQRPPGVRVPDLCPPVRR